MTPTDLASGPATGPEDRPIETRNRIPLGLVIAALFVHALLVFKLFGLAGLTSREPVTHGDWPIKFTEAYIVSGGGQLPLRTWVYSPDHLAGYPAGVFTGVGTQAYDLFLLSTREFLPATVSFRLFLFLLFLLPPFLPALAVRWAGVSANGQRGALLLALGVWHLESHIQYMWTFGTTAFVAGSAVSLCAAVVYGRMLLVTPERTRLALARGAGVGFLAGIATTLHPLCGFVLLSVCLWPFLYGLALARWRFWLAHAPAGAAFLALNAHWMIPFFQLRPEAYAGGAPGPFATGLRHLLADAAFDRSHLRAFDTTVGLQVVGLLATIGLFAWPIRGLDRRQWLVGLGCLLAISYLGSYINFFAELQPYRFLAAVILVALLPAAVGLERILEQYGADGKRISLPLIVLVALVLPRFSLPVTQSATHPRLVGPDGELLRLYDWLGTHTDRRSRILFDGSCNTAADLAPWYLKRETIGGPYDHAPIAHRYCMPGRRVATDPIDTWFGKPVDELNAQEVAERFRVLNVEWMVVEAGAPGERRAARWASVLREATRVGRFVVYRNDRCERSFVLTGTGTVESAPNELRLTGLSSGKVVLKYHYLSTLRAEPHVALSKETVLGDPVGFVSFENPGHREITIRNSYDRASGER